jgi:cytidylate kinase
VTVIAIDGPAGAGKSTVARTVAETLGFRYLDTGAMYRAVALAALEAGIPLDDGVRLGSLARSVDIDVDGTRVGLDGADVTERIRASDVTDAVSRVSAHPSVREALVEQQRTIAERDDVVVEGRDIGTIVFPNANVKVFLTASLDERARRRSEQAGLPCDDATIDRVKASIAERDDADSQRASSPLRRPSNARQIDTTDLSLDDVIAEIVRLAEMSRDAG